MENYFAKKPSLVKWTITIFVIAVLVYSSAVYRVKTSYSVDYHHPNLIQSDVLPLNDVWLDENMDLVVPGQEFQGAKTIYTRIPNDVETRNIVSLLIDETSVYVYIDGVLLDEVSVETEDQVISATGVVFFELPKDSAGHIIAIRFVCENGSASVIPEINLSSAAGLLGNFFINNTSTVAFITIMLTVALLLLSLFVSESIKRKVLPIQFLLIAATTLLSATLVLASSGLADLLNYGIDFSTYLKHVSMMALPFPIVAYIYLTCRRMRKVTFYLCAIIMLNFFSQTTLYFFNVYALSEMAVVSNVMMLMALLVCVLATATEYLELKTERSFINFCATFVMFSLITLEDLNYYIYGTNSYGRVYFQVGVLCFIVFLSSGSIKSLIDAIHENLKLQAYRRMSLEDTLTSLGSHAAFEAELIRLGDSSHVGESLGVLFLDINYLKLINDTEGHLEGDRAIVSTSDAIKSSIASVSAKAYRTGGDEFVVILSNPEDAQVVARNIQDLTSKRVSAEGNRLSVSIGVKIGTLGVGSDITKTDINSFVAKADSDMYLNKANAKKNPDK